MAYVGTKGRDLVSRGNGTSSRMARCCRAPSATGSVGAGEPRRARRVGGEQVPAVRLASGRQRLDFEGVSDYNSLQVTFSRQTGGASSISPPTPWGARRARSGDEYRSGDPFDPSRTYGVVPGRPHARLQPVLERVPPRRARKVATRRPRACSTAGSCRASRRSPAASPIYLGFGGQAGGDGVDAGQLRNAGHHRDPGRRRRPSAASHRSTRAIRAPAAPRSARRCSTSTASDSRRSARTEN